MSGKGKTVNLELSEAEVETLICAIATFAVMRFPNKEMQDARMAVEPELRSLIEKVSKAQKESGLWP